MYGYIYKITNSVTQKMYVGQTTKSIQERFQQHKDSAERYITGEMHDCSHLYRSMNKYGSENFFVELLDCAESKEELNKKETYWIKELDLRNPVFGYNIAAGGTGGDTFSGHTEEEKRRIGAKISKSNKGKKHSPCSDETKEKISISQKLRLENRTEEQKRLESIHKSFAAKNRKTGEDVHERMAQLRLARGSYKHNNETKKKLRESSTGFKSLYKDGKYIKVKGEDKINALLSDGWIFKGPPHTISDEMKKEVIRKRTNTNRNKSDEEKKLLREYASKRMSGENNPMFGVKYKWMTNGSINKRVPYEDVDTYLSTGFTFGQTRVKN